MNIRTIHNWMTIIIFSAALLLVVLGSFIDLDPSPPIEEYRYLARLPNVLEAESFARFKADFEEFHRDHLGFRDLLIRCNSLVRICVLGTSVVSSGEATVFVGDDDWLFFGYTLRDYRGEQRLSDGQFKWWKQTLRDRTNHLEQHGIPYVFFAAPAKGSIYPEHLPSIVRREEGPLALDQLVDHANSNPSIHVVDLRPSLHATRAFHRLYWKTDHHWNDFGACVAADAVFEYLQRWFPELPRLNTDELVCEETIERDGTSLARMLGLSGFYPETRHEPRHPDWIDQGIEHTMDPETGDRIWENRSNPHGLRVLCFGDSFTFGLVEPYSHQFSYVHWVSRLGMEYDLEQLDHRVRQRLVRPSACQQARHDALPQPVGPPQDGRLRNPQSPHL